MNDRLRPWLVELPANDGFLAVVLEDRLDDGVRFAGAHQVGRRPCAQQEADRLDDNGLSRARFAGQDVEAGSNSTSTASITARLRIRRKRSMRAEPSSYHIFDSIHGAC